jgi:hypothetical protein
MTPTEAAAADQQQPIEYDFRAYGNKTTIPKDQYVELESGAKIPGGSVVRFTPLGDIRSWAPKAIGSPGETGHGQFNYYDEAGRYGPEGGYVDPMAMGIPGSQYGGDILSKFWSKNRDRGFTSSGAGEKYAHRGSIARQEGRGRRAWMNELTKEQPVSSGGTTGGTTGGGQAPAATEGAFGYTLYDGIHLPWKETPYGLGIAWTDMPQGTDLKALFDKYNVQYNITPDGIVTKKGYLPPGFSEQPIAGNEQWFSEWMGNENLAREQESIGERMEKYGNYYMPNWYSDLVTWRGF